MVILGTRCSPEISNVCIFSRSIELKKPHIGKLKLINFGNV